MKGFFSAKRIEDDLHARIINMSVDNSTKEEFVWLINQLRDISINSKFSLSS